jgi:hypothetical protein
VAGAAAGRGDIGATPAALRRLAALGPCLPGPCNQHGGMRPAQPPRPQTAPRRRRRWGASLGMRRSASRLPPDATAATWRWLDDTRRLMGSLADGGARYSGWGNRHDKAEDYFGRPNFERLRRIKRRYDPGDAFRNGLTVRPAPARRKRRRRRQS